MAGRVAVLMSIAAELRIGGVLPPIIYGVAYSATLFQIGGSGTLVYTDPGALVLPAGIVATDNGDGSITFAGISTASGSYPITIDGLDGDRNPVTATFTLTVQVLPISISGDADDMRIGDSDTFSGYGVTGGSGTGYIWAIASGALPPGWGPINAATGHIPRTPTTVGNYSWGVQVTDSLGNVSAVYADSATIRYAAIALTGAFTSLGIIGVPYSSDIPISGGDGTYSNPRFTSGAVSGMALSIVTVSGVKKLRLSGTPTTQETDSITVAVDAHEFDGTVVTATHSQSVTEDPALTLTGTFTSPATPGAAYQSRIPIGGGSGSYSLHGGSGVTAGALPAGGALSIVTITGVQYLQLDGPLTTYSGAFTVRVDDADGQTVSLTMTVVVSVTITGAFATPLYSGVAYNQSITIAGGSGTYSTPAVATGAVPTGLALSIAGSNLTLSGTNSVGTTFTFTCTVHDSLGNVSSASASQSLTRQDQNFASVVSLLHFDGANNSTTFTDQKGKTWTPAGSAKISTTQSKWGGSSGLLVSASAGAVSTPTSSDFDFGSGDFTIDAWVYPNSLGAALQTILSNRRSVGNAIGFLFFYNSTNSGFNCWDSSNGVIVAVTGPAPTNGAWNHIRINRSGNVWTIWTNGSAGTPATASGTIGTGTTCYIGNDPSNAARHLDAYIDDLRVTKGIARAGGTVPSDAFPNS